VVIEGESGTGKEMLMRAMHGASPRNKEALRTVNLASVPPGSIESVLFGHESGSFPGAFDRQIGAFQHCDGGTLILDEIDRLTPALQQRLGEALESGIIRPVGASYGFRVDVRLLVTSNAGLDLLVDAGQFDAGLAARLGMTCIHLPPLRKRTGDIPALTRHFLARIGEQPGLNHLSISESALALLAAYDWPGNVRQLRNVVERTIIMTPREKLTTVEPDMLPAEITGGQIGMTGDNLAAIMGVPLREARESFEREYLAIQIRRFSGNISKTASFIGMERSALHRKLKLLGMADRREDGEGE
jgi:DNA-binding NtrC family response regulator